MIICAAIKIFNAEKNESIVLCGYRHANCMKLIEHLSDEWKKCNSPRCVIQGFMDHEGDFLDRKEAYRHAVECGQLNQHTRWYREDNAYEEELYSEDLY